MKKFFSMLGLLAFSAAALVSCESDEDGKVPDPGLSDAALSRLVVRYDEARQTADEVGRALGRTVVYESFYVRKNMRTGDARDTLLYVFNYDDNGFAVVATDRRVNKLLAVAENGPYHPKLIPGMNGYYCGMFFYMTALIDELEALSARPFTVDVPDVPGRVESRETRTVGESAEPAITVEWGYRTWPYNTYCRKSDGTLAPAGSAAAAVAQIMEACSFPERMELTYPDAEVASADLDWERSASTAIRICAVSGTVRATMWRSRASTGRSASSSVSSMAIVTTCRWISARCPNASVISDFGPMRSPHTMRTGWSEA